MDQDINPVVFHLSLGRRCSVGLDILLLWTFSSSLFNSSLISLPFFFPSILLLGYSYLYSSTYKVFPFLTLTRSYFTSASPLPTFSSSPLTLINCPAIYIPRFLHRSRRCVQLSQSSEPAIAAFVFLLRRAYCNAVCYLIIQ